MSEYLVARIRAAANVVVHEQTEIEALHGGSHLEAIRLRNNLTGAATQLPCAAVFVFIGADPAAEWLPAEIARDAKGFVLTGTDVMATGLWPRSDRELMACSPGRRKSSRPLKERSCWLLRSTPSKRRC
jgi:thioredoxin reductase (NADPH)